MSPSSTHSIVANPMEKVVIRPYRDGDTFLGETLDYSLWYYVPAFLQPRWTNGGRIRTAPICEPWGSVIFDVFTHIDLLETQQSYRNLVALQQGNVVGVCLFDLEKNTVVALCVHPEHRKYNLGSVLLTRMLTEIYKVLGPVNVRLDSSPEAVKFYKREGFVLEENNTEPEYPGFVPMVLYPKAKL